MKHWSILPGVALLSALLLVLSLDSAMAQKLTQYATDQTSTLSGAELSALESKLASFDRATSTQVVVLMVASGDSGSLEETTYRIAEENAIGRRDKNNGVLLFIAKNDRKIRIEVGYGLEGVLTDALCGVIIRHEIAPRFREGEYYEGINAGVDAIVAATKHEYTADRENTSNRGVGFLPIIVTILIFFWVASLNRRRRGIGGMYPPMFFPGGGRSSGGWGGGGGGFSGGGGSFGGGGASGSW